MCFIFIDFMNNPFLDSQKGELLQLSFWFILVIGV